MSCTNRLMRQSRQLKSGYRIGKLYQEEGRFEQALQSYYRSESCASLEELSMEMGRRVQECLQRVGKLSALRYELSERVGLNHEAGKEGDVVVAEIGAERITASELDRHIETKIEAQLASLSSYLPDEDRRAQKEKLLKQLHAPDQRLQLLQQVVVEEILYRKANASKLADDPETRWLLREMEKGFLAQRMIEREVNEQIRITPSDVETFYKAGSERYTVPARARIRHLLVSSKEEADTALRSLEAGEEFEELAKTLSEDQETREHGGEIEGWISKGTSVPMLGDSKQVESFVFSGAAGAWMKEPVQTDRGYHLVQLIERQEERPRPFEEVRQEAYRDLRAQKEKEVQELLLTKLRNDYQVVIHHAAITHAKDSTDEKP